MTSPVSAAAQHAECDVTSLAESTLIPTTVLEGHKTPTDDVQSLSTLQKQENAQLRADAVVSDPERNHNNVRVYYRNHCTQRNDVWVLLICGHDFLVVLLLSEVDV